MAMQAPYGEQYKLLAEVHKRQSRLSAVVGAASDANIQSEISTGLERCDVKAVKSYIERLDSYFPQISIGPQHQQARSHQPSRFQELFFRERSLVQTPIAPVGLDFALHQNPGGVNIMKEVVSKEENLQTQDHRVRNYRSIQGLRSCLQRNNDHLATGGRSNPTPFKGRPLDDSASPKLLAMSVGLNVAINKQIQLSRQNSEPEPEDPAARLQIVAFAEHWASKKWNAEVCDQYMKCLAEYNKEQTATSSHPTSHKSGDSVDSSESEDGKPISSGSSVIVLEPETRPRSSVFAQSDSRPAAIVGIQSFGNPSHDQGPADNYLEHWRSMSGTMTNQRDRLIRPSYVSANQMIEGSNIASEDQTIPASGEATFFGGLPARKKIRISLRLSEDDTMTCRKMFWFQPMTRDDFFQQVSERFRGRSVLSIETVLDGDKTVVEPAGSEDEWEILQEEFWRMLEHSSPERLHVDAIVRVESNPTI